MAYTSEQLKAFGLTQQPTSSSTPTLPSRFVKPVTFSGPTDAPSTAAPEPTAYDRAMEILNARASTPANTTATPETIAPQPELSLPESKPDTRTSGLLTMIRELQGQNALREAEFNQSRDDLKGSMERMNEFPERAGEIREEEGVNTFRRQVDEIDSLIASRSRALERQIELLESQPISGAMATRQAQQMQREATRELADLSLIQNARAGRLETAQAIATERIELELLPLEQQLEFDKFFYEENRDFLTDSQKQAFEVRIAEEERAYTEERERVTRLTDIMLTAAQYGASPTLIKQIGNAETMEEAIALATPSLGASFALDVERIRATANKAAGGSEKEHKAATTISNKLLALGLTQDDINGFDADVQELGIGAALQNALLVNGWDTTLLEAIIAAYGGSDLAYEALSTATSEANDPSLTLMSANDPRVANYKPEGFFGRVGNLWNNLWN